MIEAIVLAGSLNDNKLREVSTQPYEALIPLAGKPMVEYVLAALQKSPSISRIIVVGPAVLRDLQYDKVTVVEATNLSVMDNFRLGLEHISGNELVLVATSDIPLLTPVAVEDFIGKSLNQEGELFYSIVNKESNDASFPDVQRTYVKLKEGTFTGGNLFLFHPGIVEKCWSFVERMVKLRKKPVQMCALLGWLFIVKLLLGQLTIADLEQRVGNLLQIRARAVISPYPEVGIDVDKPADYQLMEKVLSTKHQSEI
jgi:GTP:adenosylcobinamide-phosphate guanylyltransferase